MGNRYLIDTHVLLWWLFDDAKLCEISRRIIANKNYEILVSSATAWEIATKYRIGKLNAMKYGVTVHNFYTFPVLRYASHKLQNKIAHWQNQRRFLIALYFY